MGHEYFTVLGSHWSCWTIYWEPDRWPIRKRLDTAKEAEIARLNKEAGEARKAAGEAMERVASAEKQAVDLNKKAEEERRARVQIEERLAHRKVSPGQAKILKEELHSLKGHKIVVTTAALQPEIVEYAKQLTDALRQAGLDASFQGALLPVQQAGFMFVSSPDRMQDAEAIAVAFTKAGMAIRKPALQSITTAGELQVVVGPKE